MSTPPWRRYLRRLREEPSARARLVCFPHAGGAASSFVPWVDHLPTSIGLWAIQPPAREDRLTEPAIDIMSAAKNTAEALQWFTDLPYALFGHSMGALIAYETTRRLESQRQRGPVHLFASSCAAPIDHPHSTNGDIQQQVLAMMQNLGLPATTPNRSDTTQLAEPAIRQDLQAFLTYHHGPGNPVSCPITVLGGNNDPEVPTTALERWHLHTNRDLDTKAFPGGHFYLFDHADQIVTEIARKLIDYIK